MLTFNEAEHRYEFNGAVVPSVTQVLSPLYDFSMIAPAVLEHARQRGVAVHRAVQLDINDDLVEASVAPEIAGYLRAWRLFRFECGIRAVDFGEPERPMFHTTYCFAGTPDVPLAFKNRWAVLDLKTADALHPAWALQTAAYKALINANTPKGQHRIEDRYTLRLREDGAYRLDEFNDRNDWFVFLSYLTLHNWKGKQS